MGIVAAGIIEVNTEEDVIKIINQQKVSVTIHEDTDFTLANDTPTDIILTRGLSNFHEDCLISFFIGQSDVRGEQQDGTIHERGLVAEIFISSRTLQNLPIVTDTDFSSESSRNVAICYMPRFGNINDPEDFGHAAMHIGRKSDTVLRISFSHAFATGPVDDAGILRLKVLP